MMFTGDAPRAVEVMTAAAAAAAAVATSSPDPSRPHRAAALRVTPLFRLPQPPPFRDWENKVGLHRSAGVAAAASVPASSSSAAASASYLSAPSLEQRPAGARYDRFDRIRAKLMNNLRAAAGRFELPATGSKEAHRNKLVKDMDADGDVESPAAASMAVPANHVSVASAPAAAVGEQLPWNLRTRRSTVTAAAPAWRHNRQQPNTTFPALWRAVPPPTPHATSRPRYDLPERREPAPRRRRPPFLVPLTKEEIDDDLYAFTGRRGPRRAKKRSRAVQKQLDMLFPGLGLSEVTVDTYQVADPPPLPS